MLVLLHVVPSNTAIYIDSELIVKITFISLFTEDEDFSLPNSTLTFDTNVTFDQGANDSYNQVLAINISDDQLVEGTESFVVSGNVTAPASFVPGGDMVTVGILDNDGKFEVLNMQSWCLDHKRLHASLKITELIT